jgi:hypothetical protein
MKGNPKDWHKGHTQKLIPLESGPHAGKWICADCKNKWVRWASKKEIEDARKSTT